MDLYQKWLYDWHFDEDAVMSACGKMTGGDPSFAYLDGILARLKGDGEARTGIEVENSFEAQKQKRACMREVLEKCGLEKVLTLNVFESLYDNMTALYPQEVVLMAAEECAASRSREGRVEKIQLLLESWKGRGLEGSADVKAYLDSVREKNRMLRELFDRMDHAGAPTAADRELLNSWMEKGLDMDLLCFAAEQSRGAKGNKLRYMEKVIGSMTEKGIRTIQEAVAQGPVKSADTGTNASPKKLNAQNYDQRTYTPEELEQMRSRLIKGVLEDDE